MTWNRSLWGLLLFLLASCARGPSPPPANPEKLGVEALSEARYPAVEPTDAEGTFVVRNGFRMRLIASEPLVYDPVAMVYDENGRAYVAEMSDYPYTDKETSNAWEGQMDQAPIGRVRLLEDTDGDGTFDQSTIFAEHLSWPTGLAVWKGGVYVTATPDIWYFKDTDGDKKADIRRKVYTGFHKYNVQAVINNPQFGLDHRFYGAGASNGGTISSPVFPDLEPVELGRNDFRFDPMSGEFDIISGGARFGNSWDDWGNRFICHIRNPVMHVVLPDGYLGRNPYLVVPDAVTDVSLSGDNIPVFGISPPEPWRSVRALRQATDPSYAGRPASEMVAQGYWTSSSGITVYRGDAYPEEYRDDVFIGEVANNVIHRQDLTPDGVTFTSKRADADAEFVASRDTWFRGVNLANAPDGTLHVLDMYREVIEHPWSIPDDIHAQLNLLSGTDRGRIYRLEPPDFTVPAAPRLGESSSTELVRALEHPNGWWRDTAHRLIYERQDRAAVDPLRRLLRSSTKPTARLHALWSLKGLGALHEDDLHVGLRDEKAGVREHSVRLAEEYFDHSAGVLDRVLELSSDSSIRVRFQVGLSLGEVGDDRVPAALAQILIQDPDDKWVRTAVLSSAAEISGRILTALSRSETAATPAPKDVVAQLARVVGARSDSEEVSGVLQLMSKHTASEQTRHAVLAGLGDGLNRSGMSLRLAVEEMGGETSAIVEELLAEAAERALRADLPTEERQAAVEVLAYDSYDRAVDVLRPLLQRSVPEAVQLETVRALSQFDRSEVAAILLEDWPTYSAAVRGEVLEVVLSRNSWTHELLDVIAGGQLPKGELGEAARIRLLKHRNEEIGSRAQSMFEPSVTRDQVIARYRLSASRLGDDERGREIYQAVCSSCHQYEGMGVDLGPNLASVRHKAPMEILTGILDPNREVSPEYVLYEVEMKDGQTATGMISSETSNSVTLKRIGGVETTLLRQNVQQIRSTGRSLMPEALEAVISEEEMSDLLAFMLQE